MLGLHGVVTVHYGVTVRWASTVSVGQSASRTHTWQYLMLLAQPCWSLGLAEPDLRHVGIKSAQMISDKQLQEFDLCMDGRVAPCAAGPRGSTVERAPAACRL